MIIKITWNNLKARPFSTFTTLLGISIALTFLGGLWTVVENIDRVRSERHEDTPRVTVFLDSQLSKDELITVKQEIQKHPLVSSVQQISKGEAIEGLEAEFGSVLSQAIGKDVLPTALNLEMAKPSLSHEEVDEMVLAIRSIKGVLELDSGLSAFPSAEGVSEKVQFFNWTWLLFIMVVSVVALLVSHLIRLAFEGSRSEIETMKIMGASKKFLVFPLILEGLSYGIAGAFVSLLIVYSLVRFVLPLVSNVILPSGVEISYLSYHSALCLVVTSIGASIVGALFTMPIISKKQSEIL